MDTLIQAMQNSWELRATFRVLAAAALGGLVGLEREHHGRSAGFRTQMLVAVGSALAMVVSLNFGEVYSQFNSNSALRIDPARVAYGVMGGIGFLGAGTIVKFGVSIRGMTTAASLWCVAAMGLACGCGMYVVAAICTALTLFVLLGLTKIDQVLIIHWYKDVSVTIPCNGQDNIARFRQVLASHGVSVIDSEFTRDVQRGQETITFHIKVSARRRPTQFNWFDGEKDILRISVR